MWLFGARIELPGAMLAHFPELADATWRRGGLALRIGGWCLGRATVSGITLGHTVALASSAALDAELLLHEVRHVHQFEADPYFPLRYAWRSVRHGYTANPYEVDARAYAARRLAESHLTA